ncbi:MAG: anthranilate synthase component I [Nitrospirae bacterium]|nr:anthranilate synthase component I [Nitrospirota bacterium]MBI3595178.1 anthranilate synthase component I [Nitrospirota bacterium]
MYFPNFKDFKQKSKEGNLIPVFREVLADFETPVTAFLKIDQGDYSFLLESVEQGEKIGRYTFMGSTPFLVFESKGKQVTLIRDGKKEVIRDVADPLLKLQELMASFKPVAVDGIPPFHGGAVGYISYDAVRFMEKIPDLLPDPLKVPDLFFLITDTILVFDHINHRIKVISNAWIKSDVQKAYDEAVRKINRIIKRLESKFLKPKEKVAAKKSSPLFYETSKKEFLKAVASAKEHIRAGDIFQIQISQRISKSISVDPFTLYRALRQVNPSPYLFYLKLKELKIVGSSPELLVRSVNGKVQTRPIAGTYRRGTTKEEDLQLEKKLLADPKERAEHVMLVDLGRNDLGRVCDYHSVHVDEFMIIEKYSHVMHIVSNVVGDLNKGKNAFDSLKACFPAGTLTGAPKIRAMEIIETLEKSRRGVYGGAVGYFSFSGNLDTAIAIRTMVVHKNRVYFQAAAGIVADSVPESEYEETLNKMKALMKALELAEEGL